MINKILDDLIQEAREYPDWKAVSALRCAKKELLKEIDFCGKWISVKDRLPEDPPWEAKWVAVWFGNGSEIHTEAPCIGKYNTYARTWLVLGKALGADTDIMKVTHWMPLPEPPKEG